MDEDCLEVLTSLHAIRMASDLCQRVRNELVPEGTILKSDRSPVTIADYGSQAILCKMIKEEFPEDVIAAEEGSDQLRKPGHSRIRDQVTDYVSHLIPGCSAEDVCSWIEGRASDRGFGESKLKEVSMRRNFVEVVEKEVPKNCVLISVGLPGSWKSPVTEAIAKMKGFQILRSDMVRLEVLKGEDVFDSKVASDPDRRKRVYEEMFRRAGQTLKREEGGLILDATFFTQELRAKAAELANQSKRIFVIAECVCTEERSLERILKRTKEKYESNALTREAYFNNKALFQPVDIGEMKRRFPMLPIIHVTVDTEFDAPSDWKITEIEKR